MDTMGAVIIELPRFSTITGWPKGPEIPCATMRAETSLLPPGEPVSMRMGLLGKSCADTNPPFRVIRVARNVDNTRCIVNMMPSTTMKDALEMSVTIYII